MYTEIEITHDIDTDEYQATIEEFTATEAELNQIRKEIEKEVRYWVDNKQKAQAIASYKFRRWKAQFNTKALEAFEYFSCPI